MRARTLLLLTAAVLVVMAIGHRGHHSGGTAPATGTTSVPVVRQEPTTSSRPPISFRPPVHTAPDVDVEAMCDENGHAYRITPHTAAARARAEEMCSNLQRSLDDVGW